MKIEYLMEQKEALILDEEGINIWEGKTTTVLKSQSMREYLDKPLYIISKNLCYGVVQLKNERPEENKFLYDIAFLKRFESPISVKYSINENGTGNIEFLSDAGQTGQSDVIGTGFTASPLAPIWVINKKTKKKHKLDDEDFEDLVPIDDGEEDPDIEDFEIEPMEEVNRILNVEKRDGKWCVVHGHPMKPGSKTDKPEGAIIKSFPGTPEGKAKAEAMHKAIIISQIKRKEMNDISNFILLKPYTMQKPLILNVDELIEKTK